MSAQVHFNCIICKEFFLQNQITSCPQCQAYICNSDFAMYFATFPKLLGRQISHYYCPGCRQEIMPRPINFPRHYTIMNAPNTLQVAQTNDFHLNVRPLETTNFSIEIMGRENNNISGPMINIKRNRDEEEMSDSSDERIRRSLDKRSNLNSIKRKFEEERRKKRKNQMVLIDLEEDINQIDDEHDEEFQKELKFAMEESIKSAKYEKDLAKKRNHLNKKK